MSSYVYNIHALIFAHKCPSLLRIKSTHGVAIATFWLTFYHDGKISPAWWEWRVHVYLLSLFLPSRTNFWCTQQVRGQIYSPYFYSTSLCTLWLRTPLLLSLRTPETIFVNLLWSSGIDPSLAGRYSNPIFIVPARQTTYPGGVDSSESMLGLHKRLQIRALPAPHGCPPPPRNLGFPIIRVADPDPGGQKWPTKKEKSEDISWFELLDVLFLELKAPPVAWASFTEALG
jgi:hypothetical protein